MLANHPPEPIRAASVNDRCGARALARASATDGSYRPESGCWEAPASVEIEQAARSGYRELLPVVLRWI
jgi:hypothetical protein